MRAMLLLVMFGITVPAVAADGLAQDDTAAAVGETSLWMRAEGLTSASLAAATLPPIPYDNSAAWGLVSGSAHALPDERTRIVTFWRWMHLTQLEGDVFYRCVDVIDGAGETVDAVCHRPRLPDRH